MLIVRRPFTIVSHFCDVTKLRFKQEFLFPNTIFVKLFFLTNVYLCFHSNAGPVDFMQNRFLALMPLCKNTQKCLNFVFVIRLLLKSFMWLRVCCLQTRVRLKIVCPTWLNCRPNYKAQFLDQLKVGPCKLHPSSFPTLSFPIPVAGLCLKSLLCNY